MLVDNFYTLESINSSDFSGKIKVDAFIKINAEHPIFNGHFPNQPVVPGVCMIQIVKEVLENHLRTKLFLTSAGNIKFLTMIIPQTNSALNVEIIFTQTEKTIEADARLYHNETTFFKIKGTFSNSL